MCKILEGELNLEHILMDAKPIGIIHAGAYIGGCNETYRRYNIANVCWIEANPTTFKQLVKNVPPTDVTLNFAVCDKDNEMPFFITSNGQSSSLLPLKKHSEVYPGIVVTEKIIVNGRRFDTLVEEGLINMAKYDFLLMDLQGGEYFALRGFEQNIKNIDYIMAEINYGELYGGCMLVDDFDKYLDGLGFQKIFASKCGGFMWGDAYYKRR
jgi:FkbM family methyltransferase